MGRFLKGTGLAGLGAVMAINTACDGTPIGSDTDLGVPCADGGNFVEASFASVSMTRLIIDQRALQSTFNSSAVYDDGPAACIDDVGNTISLVFEVDGEPYGRIKVGADAEGQQTLGQGTLQIELFGDETPVTFTGSDFTTGSWFVDSLTPSFETDLLGDAQQNGRFLTLTFAAKVTP